MFRGIYTATNAMRTDTKRIDTITNNIANSQTTGFKKDVLVTQAFPEQLLLKLNGSKTPPAAVNQQITVTPPANEQDGVGSVSIKIKAGYLTLSDAYGEGNYKSATVARDQDGYLRTVMRASNGNEITKFGAYLTNNAGQRVQVPEGNLDVLPNGTLQVNGENVANIVTAVNSKVIGTINGGSMADRSMINFSQGKLEATDNPLNVALEGEGFLKVMGADGQVSYTRHGAFTRSNEGILVDFAGSTVLSESGEPIELGEGLSDIQIDTQGNISAVIDGQKEDIDRLAVVAVTNSEDLLKTGQTYLSAPEGIAAQEAAFTGSVAQGYLEGSNVDVISEMAQMISLLRGYESDQRVIRSYDDIMQKAANEIGKI